MSDVAPGGWSQDAIARFLLRFARLLLTSGADSDHVRRRVEALATHLEAAVQLSIGSERVLLMIGGDEHYRTRVGHAVEGFGIEAGRLAALETLAGEIERGLVDVTMAEVQLSQIEQARSRHPPWLIILTVAAAAAALTRLFGASWPVVEAAFVAGLVNTFARLRLSRRGTSYVAVAAITACASGLVSSLALPYLGRASPALALTAAGMILVPGVPLINGVVDLVTGHQAMGLTRLASAFVVIVAIAGGLFAAAFLSGSDFPIGLQPGSIAPAEDLVFSAIAAFGYAILFDAPRRAIAPIVLCGAFAHAARTCLELIGTEPAVATLACSLLAGFGAIYMGRRLAMPWTVFAFPGVVAMIPGSYAFRAAIGGLHIMNDGARSSVTLLADTMAAGISAAVLTTSIGVGLLVASAIFRRSDAAEATKPGGRKQPMQREAGADPLRSL